MAFFFLLVSVLAVLSLPPLRRLGFLRTLPDRAALAMSVGFLVTGVMHFTTVERFMAMMPASLPWHRELVYVSGVFEILGALGLLLPSTRRWAAYGLAALLLAIFPANLHVAMSGGSVEGLPQGAWYYWLRLPFQFVFIAWALWVARRSSR
ncbi:MAG: DoxX family protein [Acidobacteria bacterium]|nr:DoxX family protein [Acidobacteriota bacterium]